MILNPELRADYFYEMPVFHVASVIFNGGLSTKGRYVRSYESPLFSNLHLHAGVEPRYYFSLTNRKSENRGGLNSGWFLALPLTINTALIYPDIYSEFGISRPEFGEFINYSAGLNVGYRYALTNRMFLEGALGGYFQSINFRQGSFHVNALIKVAYTL